LFELYRQALAEGAVEYRVAGRIREIGEDDGVLLGEGVRPAR
jgi:hypothetical protein